VDWHSYEGSTDLPKCVDRMRALRKSLLSNKFNKCFQESFSLAFPDFQTGFFNSSETILKHFLTSVGMGVLSF